MFSRKYTPLVVLLLAGNVFAQDWGWAGCTQLHSCLSEAQGEQYQRALTSIEQEQWQLALDLLGDLHNQVGLQAELSNSYAVALYRSGDIAAAGTVLESYLGQHPQAGPLFQNLTRLYEAFARSEPASLVMTAAVGSPTDAGMAAETERLIERQQAFLDSWSRGDIEQYLAFYLPQRSPDSSQSYDNWKRERERRVYPERGIRVVAENISVSFDHQTRARVRLNQVYRSADYADNTRKEFVWVLVGDTWHIESEREI